MSDFNIDYTYALGDNEGSSDRVVANKYIVLHETTNIGAKNNAQFFKNNWRSTASYSQYVIGDGGKIYAVGAEGYQAWAAGGVANANSPVQIELARTDDRATFEKDYEVFINFTREKALEYGIPLILDGTGNGIKTHNWVSQNIWGSHTDPVLSYLQPNWGITQSQLATDLQNGISTKVEETNNTSTVNNVVTVTDNQFKAFTMYDKRGNAYIGSDVISGSAWVSNSIVSIGNENLPYYQISTNGYIPQSITNFKDSITINLPADQHAYTVDDLGEKTNDTKLDATLLGGTSWRFDGTLYPMKNGVVAYQIATKRFLPVQFAQGSGYSGK